MEVAAIGALLPEVFAGVVGGNRVGVVGGGGVIEFKVETGLNGGFDAVFIRAVDGDDGLNAAAFGGAQEHGGLGVAKREDRGVGLGHVVNIDGPGIGRCVGAGAGGSHCVFIYDAAGPGCGNGRGNDFSHGCGYCDSATHIHMSGYGGTEDRTAFFVRHGRLRRGFARTSGGHGAPPAEVCHSGV